MTETLVFDYDTEGYMRCLWTDQVNFTALGTIEKVERASDVEWDVEMGGWRVYLKDGTVLPGAWPNRADAIRAEVDYLQERLS
jgi:hypothetical protein